MSNAGRRKAACMHLCGFVVLRLSGRGLQDIHDDGFHPTHFGI